MRKIALDVLLFLNSDSGAILALAAVLSLFVTIILVLITRRYVLLTRSLAKSTTKQLGILEKERETERWEFAFLLERVLQALVDLPSDKAKAEEMRKTVTWTDRDIEDLKRLSVEVNPKSKALVTKIVPRLLWIKERIEEVKGTDSRDGVNWIEFPWDHWVLELGLAMAEIGECSVSFMSEMRKS